MPVLYSALRSIYKALNHPAAARRDPRPRPDPRHRRGTTCSATALPRRRRENVSLCSHPRHRPERLEPNEARPPTSQPAADPAPPLPHRGRRRVGLDRGLPDRPAPVPRHRPRHRRASSGGPRGRRRRRDRRRPTRRIPAPGQWPGRRTHRRHGRPDPPLRLAYHLRHHCPCRRGPTRPRLPARGPHRARRQPGDRARHARRHRRDHRRRPAAHRPRRHPAELRPRQPPGPARTVGTPAARRGVGERADPGAAPPLATRPGPGRTAPAQDPGRARGRRRRHRRRLVRRVDPAQGRSAVLEQPRPGRAARGARARPRRRRAHHHAGVQCAVTARRGRRRQAGGRTPRPDLRRPRIRPWCPRRPLRPEPRTARTGRRQHRLRHARRTARRRCGGAEFGQCPSRCRQPELHRAAWRSRSDRRAADGPGPGVHPARLARRPRDGRRHPDGVPAPHPHGDPAPRSRSTPSPPSAWSCSASWRA